MKTHISHRSMRALDNAESFLGNRSALAMALGIKYPTLQQWRSGVRPIPPKRCVQIERITDGLVTRRDLRPHDYWLHWPDLTRLDSDVEH